MGFGGEARKRLGVWGMLVEWRGRLAGGWTECGSGACPLGIPDEPEPQENYQQEVIEKDGVYPRMALLLGELDDRLPDSQTGDFSARCRYTTAAFVIQLRAYWARIAVRVAGSWIAASGLLMLGWSFRGG
jgi:hypothetical protein